ncbi:response regulator [Aquabacterium sp. A7-Y]|uniref:response regulator n=1 Tax=Aquabacterium sp. A7-Y TaxID=1349605 RepID=UPI00223CE822|nr:response regulator [Aquabacterium sp. A7-Y]MCW7537344.1 response regulator [Aquabacterium sp. A7-Y]
MPSILVVDDEFSNLEALALTLSEEGYQVAVASNGRRALEILDEAKPDLIITDHMMPVMNGAQLIEAVRAIDRHAATLILMMSGVPEAMLHGLAEGYDDFLRKPFEIDQLLERVKVLLEQARRHRPEL